MQSRGHAAGGHGGGASNAAASAVSRLPEMLEWIRQEFEGFVNDAHSLRAQVTDYDAHSQQHSAEMSSLRLTLIDLERQHTKLKERYEEEIAQLKRELESRGPPSASAASSAPPPPQVGHGSVSLFGGIIGGATGTDASAPSQLPAAAPSAPANGYAERDGADHPPPKRLRTDDGASYAGRVAPPPLRSLPSGSAQPAASPGGAGSTSATPSSALEMDPDTAPRNLKKEGTDWVTVFNPKVPRALDVELVHTLQHESVVCCVKFSPDGKTLATGCNRNTNLFDTKTGAKQCVLVDESSNAGADNYIRSACFSPDGTLIATGSEDRIVRVWDIAKRSVRQALSGHKSEIYSLAFSPDGRQLVSGSGDRTAMIWDVESGSLVRTLVASDGPSTGENGAAAGPADAGVTSVALSADGSMLAAGSLDTVVRIWDARTGALLDKLRGHKDSVYSVAFAPHGGWLVSGSLDKTLKIWELEPLRRLIASGGSSAAPTDADADGLAKGDQRATCTTTLSGHKDYVLSVAVSPTGDYILSGSKDRGVSFWTPSTASAAVVLQGHKNSVISIAVSEVGNLLATGSGDWSCRVWRMDRAQSTADS